jgi:hypothetical protein
MRKGSHFSRLITSTVAELGQENEVWIVDPGKVRPLGWKIVTRARRRSVQDLSDSLQ